MADHDGKPDLFIAPCLAATLILLAWPNRGSGWLGILAWVGLVMAAGILLVWVRALLTQLSRRRD